MRRFTRLSNHPLVMSLLIGALGAAYCFFYVRNLHGSVDFAWPYEGARLLRMGANPYRDFFLDVGYDQDAPLYYPLPALMLVVPLTWFPIEVAAAIFHGIATAGLAFFLLRTQQRHRLLVFASASFLVISGGALFPTLVMLAAVCPLLLPLTMVKPNLGVPVVVTYASVRGMVLCALVGIGSLVILPTWPLDWLANLGKTHHEIPLAVFPGILVLLAAFRWRDSRARLLLGLAVVPQRLLFYDQILLWLIPNTFRESLILTVCSWLGFFGWMLARDYFGGGLFGPATAVWVISSLYLPALGMVFYQRRSQHDHGSAGENAGIAQAVQARSE